MVDRGQQSELLEEVMDIGVHTKVTKGGRKLSFSALVAVGNGHGKVGLGYGKAAGVPQAIEKGGKEARRNMVPVALMGDTVAHQVTGRHASTRVMLKPAAPGTGVKAGGTVRAMMSVVGVHNVLSKCFGSNNALNVARATLNALRMIRSADEVQRLRGVSVKLNHPQKPAGAAVAQPESGAGGEPVPHKPAADGAVQGGSSG